MPKDSDLSVRGSFDFGLRTKPQAVPRSGSGYWQQTRIELHRSVRTGAGQAGPHFARLLTVGDLNSGCRISSPDKDQFGRKSNLTWRDLACDY